MRPRKVVLLFCADETRRSVLRFMLCVRGFHVVETQDLRGVECAVVVANPVNAPGVAYSIAEADRELPLLVIARKRDWKYYPIGARLLRDSSTPDVLLEQIRLATIRKRGPKKCNNAASTAGNQSCQLA